MNYIKEKKSMTPLHSLKEMITHGEKLLAQKQWHEYELLCREVEERCLMAKDFAGLMAFHEAGLKQLASAEEFEKIRVEDLAKYQADFSKGLNEALAKARTNPAVKAIYFEYFYDGGDASDGNFFLCESFDDEDDDWASDFAGEEGLVPGFSILPYMDFDPDGDMDDDVTTKGYQYVDACLLAASLEVIEARGGITYPFGFAQHDWPVTIYTGK